jgi:hypothetical protein
MSSGKRRTERGDARGGGFFLLPHSLLASKAFRTASPRAVKMLLTICGKHNGFNNGAIGLGFREMAELMSSQNHAANSKALCELIERGLLAVERTYPRGQRRANEYRLTFVATGDVTATNDYLTWKVGDAGTRNKGNFRASKTSTRSVSRVVKTPTGVETSRCENLNASNAKSPILPRPPVAETTTHIVKPFEESSASPRKSPLKMPGHLSAAPDAEGLRARVLSVVEAAGRGSQGQLAAIAAIRPAALSKFLHNAGSLSNSARIRLTMALPKVQPTMIAGRWHKCD